MRALSSYLKPSGSTPIPAIPYGKPCGVSRLPVFYRECCDSFVFEVISEVDLEAGTMQLVWEKNFE